MELTITPKVEALLQREMSTGRFEDPNDLIETALLVLADSTPYDLESLNAKIDEGLNDIARGDVFTEDEARVYLADMRAKL
jgi:hypothetical protein